MDNSVERVEKVVYADAVRQTACFDKILLPLGKFACGGVFLQDDKVAADIRSGIVGKKIVRQAHGCNHIAAIHQPFAHGPPLFGVQDAL